MDATKYIIKLTVIARFNEGDMRDVPEIRDEFQSILDHYGGGSVHMSISDVPEPPTIPDDIG